MNDSTRLKKLNSASDRIGGMIGALKFLDQFPSEVQRKVLKPAMKAADLVGVRAAYAEAAKHDNPERKRGVHLSATAGAAEAARGSTVVGMVGYFGTSGSHGWLVEHGHRIVSGGTVARINKARKDYGKVSKAANKVNTGAGQVVGEASPHPILRPAYLQSRAAIEQVFAAEVIRRADAMATRLAKQTGAI